MILLCGIPSEPPVRLVAEAASQAGVPYVHFNQREAHFADLLFDLCGGGIDGWLSIRGRRYSLGAFTGAFVRLMDPQQLPELQVWGRRPPDAHVFRKTLLVHDYLNVWFEHAPLRVLNRSRPSATNGSKPLQAQAIVQAGFRIPETLITNDPEEVRAFLAEHPRLVYKSISAVRSIVQELTPDRLHSLDRVRDLPTQFQEYVPGTNVRVHVVGERVFATEIESEAIDYRYAGRQDLEVSMRPTELPDSVREQCLALGQRLELPLCGIDLKHTPEGAYYCFEVNPAPAYNFYQEHSHQPIASAIVDYLAGRLE